MNPPPPHFQLPLNLPHAGRIARRIVVVLRNAGHDDAPAFAAALEMESLLAPYYDAEENPPGPRALRIREQAAQLGRRLVQNIANDGLGHDRLGQCVRNYFECLELGREGAELSLLAGENPGSLQRPV
ncbi:MAG: hypothetical protein RLZZ129_2194 [Verrucomicrobiota bacterium]